jgi:cell division protein FtsI/penicillin-binding protein 2
MSRLSPMRPFFILAPLGLLYLAIFGRVVQLHAYPEKVENGVSDILHDETTLPAMRGAILDRYGSPLAYDRPAYELLMSSRWQDRRYHPDNRDEDLSDELLVEEIRAVAKRCQLDVEKLAEAVLDPETSYRVLRRGIDPFDAQAMRSFLRNYRGMGLELSPTLDRVYPLGRAYSSLLGIVSGQGKHRTGLSGLEVKFDPHLQGVQGSKGSQLVTGAFGINPAKGLIQPQQGNALQTTLDADLGKCVREVLATSMREHQPVWNGAVVIDVNTGEILSLLGMPDYDPTDPWVGDDGRDHSGEKSSFALAIENAVVPGSTFKPFVVGWAVEKNYVRTTDTFADNGIIYVPGRRKPIKNARFVQPGSKTPSECLIHSSNVVSVQIGQRIGVDGMQTMLERFGFWDPVVVGRRNSPRGIRPAARDWEGKKADAFGLPTLSFGHGLMVNPIRYAACMASLVNGGRRIEPHLIALDDGISMQMRAQQAHLRTGLDQPIRATTSAFLVDAMEKMAERRIGRPLPLIEGVRWGGKSGTARNEVNTDLNTCVFSAFGPIPNPEILVLVIVQFPQVENPSGTKVAGPLAGEILRHALRIRGLLPSRSGSSLDSGSSNANLNPR